MPRSRANVDQPDCGRKPSWLKAAIPGGANHNRLRDLMRSRGLHTVCESARCPNVGECWEAGTATFMILGDVCTRSCSFCAVKSGRPEPWDPAEAEHVAMAAAAMELRHAVITSVDRDDLPDRGARAWAEVIRVVRRRNPATSIECLVPDFGGREVSIDEVLAAAPDIFAHNLETVERLTPMIRSGACYDRSLAVLARSAQSGAATKTGLMLGLGEKEEEIRASIRAAREAGATLLTIGQYLRPTPAHVPVARWVSPAEFDCWREEAMAVGFAQVVSGPLVRSSYHAAESLAELRGHRV